MVAFIGVLSLLGFLICIVLTVINAVRKKSVKNVATGIAVCFVIFIVCLVITPTKDEGAKETEAVIPTPAATEEIVTQASVETAESETAETQVSAEDPINTTESASEAPAETQESKEPVEQITYDTLQQVFLAIGLDITEEDVLDLIEENSLEYTVNEYNGTIKNRVYKIAYEEGVALQSHADSGDYIEVEFATSDGSFLYAEYFNEKAFREVLLYNYGTYWDFREKEGNNDYTGYYYHTPGSNKGGITIHYSNGNSTETGYHAASTAEEALQSVIGF